MKTDSLFLCLNTEAGKIPEKIKLLPAGEFIAGRDGRRWIKLDAVLIAKNSNAYLTHHPIDENHATDLKAPKGESSPAMGWFSNVTAADDGSVWADTSWTEKGTASILNREYRYISPVFESDAAGNIVKILRAALTNSPNLELPNLNSIKTEQADNPAKEETQMKKIFSALGLAETSMEDDALVAIAGLKTQANSTKTVDLAAYAPRADLAQMEVRATAAEAKLAELNAARLKDKATAAVEKAVQERKIAPASKAEYLNLCSTEAGLANFTKIMEATPAIISEGQSVPSGTPPKTGEVELNAEDESICKAMGYTKEEWLKIKKEAK